MFIPRFCTLAYVVFSKFLSFFSPWLKFIPTLVFNFLNPWLLFHYLFFTFPTHSYYHPQVFPFSSPPMATNNSQVFRLFHPWATTIPPWSSIQHSFPLSYRICEKRMAGKKLVTVTIPVKDRGLDEEVCCALKGMNWLWTGPAETVRLRCRKVSRKRRDLVHHFEGLRLACREKLWPWLDVFDFASSSNLVLLSEKESWKLLWSKFCFWMD